MSALRGSQRRLLVLHGVARSNCADRARRKLSSLAREPKRFVRFPLGGHVDLDDNGAQKAVRNVPERARWQTGPV